MRSKISSKLILYYIAMVDAALRTQRGVVSMVSVDIFFYRWRLCLVTTDIIMGWGLM